MGDVWVYIEHKKGVTSPMSYELLGIGKQLAADLGGSLCAFVIGESADEIAKEAGAYGASKVFAVEGAVYKDFRADVYGKAAGFLLEKGKPAVALFRATSQGADVAAASAAKLGFGLCTDTIGLAVDGGKVKMTRAAFGGNYTVSVVNEKAAPQIATVRPKAYAMPEKGAGTAEVVKEAFALADADVATKVVEFLQSASAVNLVEADIIVSGGRGLGNEAGFEMLQQLADMLGGAVGASRA